MTESGEQGVIVGKAGGAEECRSEQATAAIRCCAGKHTDYR